MAKPTTKPLNRRGSPEAIEKRRAARQFNDVLGGRGASAQKLDGRTEKRRQRLLKELEAGVARGHRDLKPLDVLQRVQELMDLGETLGSIRKVAKVRKATFAPEVILGVVQRLHEAYKFRPEAYRFVGIGDDVLRGAGVIGGEPSAGSGSEAKREGAGGAKARLTRAPRTTREKSLPPAAAKKTKGRPRTPA